MVRVKVKIMQCILVQQINKVISVVIEMSYCIVVLLHSGEVYAFGNGNHGQLGQGNNKIW